jgi:hypothetical protein
LPKKIATFPEGCQPSKQLYNSKTTLKKVGNLATKKDCQPSKQLYISKTTLKKVGNLATKNNANPPTKVANLPNNFGPLKQLLRLATLAKKKIANLPKHFIF